MRAVVAFGLALAGCTAAQLSADVQAANAVIQALAPIACEIVDTTDPTAETGVCQVISDVTTGATAIVPIVVTLAEVTAIVSDSPGNVVTTTAAAAIRAKGARR